MNQKEYRAEVDALSFSPDFRDRTVARLMSLAQEKERTPMHTKHMKTALIAAAVAAALSVTAYAAVTLLGPREVAQRAGNEVLADAFAGEQAIAVNETKSVGDYQVTFMGLVSGQGLDGMEALEGSEPSDKTYAVLAYARTDGEAITEDVPDLTVSPLVEGYAPWQVNAWTLGGGTHTFAEEGVLYYLFECDNVEPFADHTVYLAVYPGTHMPPNTDLFDFDEATGSIGPKGETALFSLPLDKAKADPQRARELLGDWGEPMPEESTGPEGEVSFSFPDDSGEVIILES